MAPKKSAKAKGKDGAKPATANKNGKKAESGSGSFFTWFIVLALLGVWTSVAVVYFDLVDYQGVLGKLVAYDTDGDGDFDVEDAKILLDEKPGAEATAGAKTSTMKEPHPSPPSHHKLREALKLQLSVIRERVEAKRLARMALTQVRLLLEEEQEQRAVELGRANMSERVMERVARRLRREEERMEEEEVQKALKKRREEEVQKALKKRREEEVQKALEKRRKEEVQKALEKRREEERNQTQGENLKTRGEEEKPERRSEGRAKERPKRSRAEKS